MAGPAPAEAGAAVRGAAPFAPSHVSEEDPIHRAPGLVILALTAGGFMGFGLSALGADFTTLRLGTDRPATATTFLLLDAGLVIFAAATAVGAWRARPWVRSAVLGWLSLAGGFLIWLWWILPEPSERTGGRLAAGLLLLAGVGAGLYRFLGRVFLAEALPPSPPE